MMMMNVEGAVVAPCSGPEGVAAQMLRFKLVIYSLPVACQIHVAKSGAVLLQYCCRLHTITLAAVT
jgi:hypothetical protein